MANSEAVSGVHTYLLFGDETTYGSTVTTSTHFGIVNSFKPNVENNMDLRRGFAGTGTTAREPVKTVAGTLKLTSSVDFDVINWEFMDEVLGNSSGSGTVTYSPASNLKSMTVTHSIDNPGSGSTDRRETYTGSVIESCTIRCAVGEPVSCSLEMMHKNFGYSSTVATAVAIPVDDVFTFSGATIELPDSTSLSNVIDSAEITIRNNVNKLYGFGSRLPKRALGRALEYDLKFTLKYLDDGLLNKALGATAGNDTGPTLTTITFRFVSGSRSCEFQFSNVHINWSEDATLNEALVEDIPAVARNLSVVEVQ